MNYLDSLAHFVYPPTQEDESEEKRLNRAILLVMALSTCMGGLVWGSIYVLLGVPTVSIWPYGYVVLSAVNLGFYLNTKNYETLLVGQLGLILLIPTFLQWHIGGFSASGAVMLWAFLSPIVALVVSDRRSNAQWWFIAFVSLVIFSVSIESTAKTWNVGRPAYGVTLFYGLNALAPLITTYYIVYYFIGKGREATAALEEQSTALATANQSLQDLTQNLEKTVQERTEDLQIALNDAEAANRTKSLFLANMSHELRTPLNAIIGYSDMLREDAEDFGYDDFVPDLNKIQSAGNHLLSLINNILDISKIEAGKIDIYLEEFIFDHILTDTITTITPELSKNNNTLSLDITDAPIGLITVDETKMRQILLNLLSNATKFTSDGTITVRAKRLMRHGEEWLEVSVQDDGIGMTPEQMAHIFQEFTQADVSTTRKYGGTGLGLPISRHFANIMGGDIIVHSDVGKGSTFTLSIPTVVSENNPYMTMVSQRETQEFAIGTPNATILVIDDDATVQELLTRQLLRESYNVISAYGGDDGIKAAQDTNPDLILLDIMMPTVDGWAVLSQLKENPDLQHIPVIIHSMVNDKARGFSLGADDYLRKPVDRNVLTTILKRYIDGDHTNFNILILEDDPATQDIFKRTAERQGWQAIVAANGKIGLDAMQRQTPDIILLDIMMPEMDGLEFLATIRANPLWTHIPVIVITAKVLSEDERHQLNNQAQRVIQKSTEQQADLTLQIRDVLRSSIGD